MSGTRSECLRGARGVLGVWDAERMSPGRARGTTMSCKQLGLLMLMRNCTTMSWRYNYVLSPSCATQQKKLKRRSLEGNVSDGVKSANFNSLPSITMSCKRANLDRNVNAARRSYFSQIYSTTRTLTRLLLHLVNKNK